MKLSTRYNQINLVSSVAIFLLASVAFYTLLRYVLIRQVDDDLEIEQNEIVGYVSKYAQLPEEETVGDQQINFEEVKNNISPIPQRKFKTVWDGAGYRKLVFYVVVKGKPVKATVSKSLRASNRVTQSVVLITFGTILCMLIASLLINRLILRRLWLPFYQSLSTMQAYRIGQSRPIFTTGRIDEFNSLNQTLEESVQHAESEYLRLKEFTENAAHELQTPLAIIRSKLDVLIQDQHLSAHQGTIVQGAYDAVNRLARLNQSLLLLSKIENGQYADKHRFNLKEVVEHKIDSFRELWTEKGVGIIARLEDRVVEMNPALAEILLNNLLSNAMRHSPADGAIYITLRQDSLSIANSAAGGPLDNEKLFSRFYKGGQSSDNQGLGLSIVRQVVIASGYTISYTYEAGQHVFNVIF